jgi:hypothetical protein
MDEKTKPFSPREQFVNKFNALIIKHQEVELDVICDIIVNTYFCTIPKHFEEFFWRESNENVHNIYT